MYKIVKNEKGVVLIISLMILALLTVLSLTAILTTTSDMKISTNYKVSQVTFYNTEGSMDIAPGIIRRTISLKTEPPSILTSLGITDTDNNGISDTDEASLFSGLTVDSNGNSIADFTESIMGFVTSAPPDFTIATPPNFTITTNTPGTAVSTSRDGPVALKGFSTGFATGYEGGAMTGRGIYFNMTGTGSGDRNSQSQVQLQYRCVERSGGGCL
ncbi:MAG: pilus assembly PilX N-terminal domain-containing protein [Nitrospinota bacterium]